MQCPNGCSRPMRQIAGERLLHDGNRDPIIVANLTMDVCPDCGQESMPLESARIVERALKGEMAPTGQFTAPMFEVA